MFMSAYSAFRNRRYHEAFVTYQLLAELGYEVAQSNVAFILEEGKYFLCMYFITDDSTFYFSFYTNNL